MIFLSFNEYLEESNDPEHPKNFRIVKMHKDDTDTGKHRWDIRTNKGEGDIVDSYDRRSDAHHYLTKWRKGHDASNNIKESLVMDKPIHTKTITADELMKHIGRAKIKSIAKHPFHKDYIAGGHLGHAGYQYHRNDRGFEHVLASHTEPLKGKDGTETRRMVHFDLYKNHVENAHLFHNKNNERHHVDDGGNRIWRHIKSHKEDEE